MEQVILITGATDGIGKLAAIKLAALDPQAHILIHGRNQDKLQEAAREIATSSKNNHIETYLADFSSMDDIRRMADEIMQRHNSIRVLVNNAGAGFTAPRFGRDGIETRLAVNYLAPFLLTNLLLPLIKQGAPSRIVNVSSAGQSDIHFDDITMKENFNGRTAYTQSKLALVMFTFDLAESVKDDQVTVNALHPGTYLDTNMVREAGIRPLGSALHGAEAIVHLATSKTLEGVTGKYFNVVQESRAHAQAYDEAARNRLKHIGMCLTGLNKVIAA